MGNLKYSDDDIMLELEGGFSGSSNKDSEKSDFDNEVEDIFDERIS